MLGLIVFPKESSLSHIPKDRLHKELKFQMGLEHSEFDPAITDLRSLIMALRNSVAHFDLAFMSHSGDFQIDEIIFKDKAHGDDYFVAKFSPGELLGFVRYYAGWLSQNLKNYR